MSTKQTFEEKILYKTHQHWIIPVINSIKLIGVVAIPAAIVTYFVSGYSWFITIWVGIAISAILIAYDHYLWHHSWLMIGNQKVTLSIRNWLWSQYAMNIRYRNIRDSAVSKNSVWGYLFKYGSLFIRSSSAEWDFRATYVPKVGKIYALVNALSRYSDDERAWFDSIEQLHDYHQKSEFWSKSISHSGIESQKNILKNMKWVTAVIEIDSLVRTWTRDHEESRNHGIHEVLRRKHILALLHNSDFRSPTSPIAMKNANGEVYFPWVAFPEITGTNVISGSPSLAVHTELVKIFPDTDEFDATILIGWDD
jgi:hypothetical protein